MKYAGKMYDIDDIRYILRKFPDGIPEEVISDIYWKLLEYVPLDPVEVAKEAFVEARK